MSAPKVLYPTFDAQVPSTKEQIKLRPMLVKEEKLLLMAKEGADAGDILGAVKQVVSNCLVDKLDVNKMAIFDIEYLFVKLRSQSVSNMTQVAYIDNEEVNTAMSALPVQAGTPEYSKEFEKAQRKATYTFDVDLDKVIVQFPDKVEDNVKINDKIGVVLKYPPAELYSDKEFLSADGEKLIDLLIQKSLQTIYEGDKQTDPKTLSASEVSEFIDSMDVKSYNKIKQYFSNLPHLLYEIKYTNKNGKDRVITLTTLSDFFTLA